MADDTYLTKEENLAVADAFLGAVVELYPIASQKAKIALIKVENYPQIHMRDNGMPYFSSVWRDKARPDYQYALSGMGLLALPLSAIDEGNNLEPVKKLGRVLWDIPTFRKRLSDDKEWYAEYEAKSLVEQALLRYFNRYGVTAELDEKKGWIVLREMLFALGSGQLPLALVVPILMHQFEADHYRLTDDAYIFKMRKPFQLARSLSGNFTGLSAHTGM